MQQVVGKLQQFLCRYTAKNRRQITLNVVQTLKIVIMWLFEFPLETFLEPFSLACKFGENLIAPNALGGQRVKTESIIITPKYKKSIQLYKSELLVEYHSIKLSF